MLQGKKITAHFLLGTQMKNPQQNPSKANLVTYKQDYTYGQLGFTAGMQGWFNI